MKNIVNYITEASSSKFDYWEDVIKFPGYELKVPKKYLDQKINTRYYKEDFLYQYFGWINQWLDKNVKNIVKAVIKDNKDFPKEIWINLPSKLSGKLRLDFDNYWQDGVPHGSLRDVEIEVNHVAPIGGSEFYDAKYDLQHFKLKDIIKF